MEKISSVDDFFLLLWKEIQITRILVHLILLGITCFYSFTKHTHT